MIKDILEFRSELFYVRRVKDEDKESYKDVVAAEYLFGELSEIDPDAAIKAYWKTIIQNEINMNFSVFFFGGELIGRIALQGIDEEVPELAVVIVKKHQGKGYGYRVLRQWLNFINEQTGCNRVNVRIDSENVKSINVFK